MVSIKPKLNSGGSENQDNKNLLENDEEIESQQSDRMEKARTRRLTLTALKTILTLMVTALLACAVAMAIKELTTGRTSETDDGKFSIIVPSTTSAPGFNHRPIPEKDEEETSLIVTEEEEEEYVVTDVTSVYFTPPTDDTDDDLNKTFTDDDEDDNAGSGSGIDDSFDQDESSGEQTIYSYGTYGSGSGEYYYYHDDDVDRSYSVAARQNVYPHYEEKAVFHEELTGAGGYYYTD